MGLGPIINYQEMNMIAEKKSSKGGQKIDGNANDALGCSKRCWSDRLTMPHDHCFVGSTKKVISSHLRAAAGGEDDQGRPREGGQHGKKRGEKEEETDVCFSDLVALVLIVFFQATLFCGIHR